MGLFKDLRATMAAARGGEIDLSALTPQQRERYEANQARVEHGRAEAHAAWQEAQAIGQRARAEQVLQGPGTGLPHVATPSPAEMELRYQQQGLGGVLNEVRAQQKGQFTQALRETVGRDGPRPIKDPEERRRVAAAERAVRDAARAPYRAPQPPPVGITRIATRGATQVQELTAHLQRSGLAARPDLVYGVYRVPDRISQALTPHSERGRVVEWDVVHDPCTLPAAANEVAAAYFSARKQWVARGVGERSVLDEDLGALYCLRAGIVPESCLGIARLPHFASESQSDEDRDDIVGRVEGVLVLHPATAGTTGGAEQLAPAPLRFGPTDLPPVHMEVLDWEAVAHVVHPRRQDSYRVPSPAPYLPSSPQELLRAYLEVVGVTSADSCSAQVTIDEPAALAGTFGLGSTNLGPKLACADGTARMRLHGAQLVVLVYRDRPAYAAGRQRWAAYQQEVLQARLDHRTGVRPPLRLDTGADDIRNPVLRAGVGALEAVDRALDWFDELLTDQPPPFRYCWPPIGS